MARKKAALFLGYDLVSHRACGAYSHRNILPRPRLVLGPALEVLGDDERQAQVTLAFLLRR